MAQKSRTFSSPKAAQRDACRRVCWDPTIPADGQTAHCFPTFAVPRTGFEVVFDVAELIWESLD
jgi:hypothetical protein